MVLEGNFFVVVLESTDVLQNKGYDFLVVTWGFDCNPRSLKSPANKLISKFHMQLLEGD